MMQLAAKPWTRYALAALILTGMLGWMVAGRVRLLAQGREIELPARPVDPRDLFKGDYANLGYDISMLGPELVPKAPNGTRFHTAPRTVYVTLEKQADGAWKAVSVSDRLQQATEPSRIVLKGRTSASNPARVTYGIERYFVPEGTGGKIEQLARNKKLATLVAVDKAGNAAIKGLVADGQRIYEEPLL